MSYGTARLISGALGLVLVLLLMAYKDRLRVGLNGVARA